MYIYDLPTTVFSLSNWKYKSLKFICIFWHTFGISAFLLWTIYYQGSGILKQAPKSVSKNNYPNVSETSQNDSQGKVKPCENSCEKIPFYRKFADWRDNISEEGFS